jgi:RimJ/RimL family protein N-acetyltransferase
MHPYFLGSFGIVLSILIRWSKVLSTGEWGRMVIFSASCIAGFFISVEWMTMAHFEAMATQKLKSDPSLGDIAKMYGKDRFLVATLGGTDLIGLVGLEVQGKTGIVKHWDIKSKYRNRGLGWDLLERAINNARSVKKNPITKVECQTYNLQVRAEKSLRDNGFKRSGKDEKEGGWVGWFGVERHGWVKEL